MDRIVYIGLYVNMCPQFKDAGRHYEYTEQLVRE